jgi:hypothetical protein
MPIRSWRTVIWPQAMTDPTAAGRMANAFGLPGWPSAAAPEGWGGVMPAVISQDVVHAALDRDALDLAVLPVSRRLGRFGQTTGGFRWIVQDWCACAR